MAISGLQYDAFKPELWAAELNFSLKRNLVGNSVVNRNYEGQIRQQGDTVHVQEPGAVTRNAYTAYSDITWETPSATQRNLTIDQADYVAFNVDDIDAVQANVDLVRAHTTEASYSLANQADQFIFQMYTAANSGVASDHANSLALTSSNIYQRFVQADQVLDLQNVPSQGRWAVISPTEMALLRQAPQFVPVGDGSAFAGGGTTASAGTVATGMIGRVASFDVFVSNNLTTLSGVRKALFGTTQATTFASQITEMEGVRRESRFATGVKGLHVYGRATMRPEALAVLHITA